LPQRVSAQHRILRAKCSRAWLESGLLPYTIAAVHRLSTICWLAPLCRYRQHHVDRSACPRRQRQSSWDLTLRTAGTGVCPDRRHDTGLCSAGILRRCGNTGTPAGDLRHYRSQRQSRLRMTHSWLRSLVPEPGSSVNSSRPSEQNGGNGSPTSNPRPRLASN
jgi:hypothetical protein